MVRLVSVCGARPNFMKIAAICRAFGSVSGIDNYLVHTGQHYDDAMDRRFFRELAIPMPDINLEVGSQTHAVQTAMIMQRFEPILAERRPDAVLVVGDVNSTMAAALVASKLRIAVIHVEAGLRSFDRGMPEEINRVVTDVLSDLLFVTERSGIENLTREGIDPARIHFVGNVMIDTMKWSLAQAASSGIMQRLSLTPRQFALLTLHRPDNVDRAESLTQICGALEEIAQTYPIVFPIHPRTRASLERTGVMPRLTAIPGMTLLDPLGYLDFLKLTSEAALVLTDSGGIQEETTALGVACLTLRDNTERPVTVEQGTNRLVGRDPQRIVAAFRDLHATPRAGRIPEFWDGHAAERIARIILEWHARSTRGRA